MRLLRASEHRVMPWKNGGGSTTEIGVSPDGAGLDEFDWRVSMATVSTDGPFSGFPEIDRTLVVLSGAGIDLAIDGQSPVRLTPADAPLAFPGDVPTRGSLIEGPIVDLNVMSRRGRITHRLARYVSADPLSIALTGETNLIIARSDDLILQYDGQTIRLATDDAVLIAGTGSAVKIASEAGGEMAVFAISFMSVQADRGV